LCIEDGESKVSRRKIVLFFPQGDLGHVHFPITTQGRSSGIDDDGGVIKGLLPIRLKDRTDQGHPPLFCHFLHPLNGRAADLFSEREISGVHLFRKPVGRKKLLKTDDLSPFVRSDLGELRRLFDIPFLIFRTGNLNARQPDQAVTSLLCGKDSKMLTELSGRVKARRTIGIMEYWNNERVEYWKVGILEGWNIGILGKDSRVFFYFFYPFFQCSNVPSFQFYSIIPLFQISFTLCLWGELILCLLNPLQDVLVVASCNFPH
jgi:hypothetical protein